MTFFLNKTLVAVPTRIANQWSNKLKNVYQIETSTEDTQQNDTQYNKTQYNVLIFNTQHKW
jgi:hypothetical protein